MWLTSLSSRRMAAAVVVAAGLLVLPSTSNAEEGPQPGLPLIPESGLPGGASVEMRNAGAWLNVTQVGRAGAVPALQWVTVPITVSAANIDFITTELNDANGTNYGIVGDYSIEAFLVPASSDEPYGNSPPITARTVAFGSIPTEIQLQLRQRRDADNLPVSLPLRARFSTNDDVAVNTATYEPTTLRENVELAVVGFKLDGVDVPLTSTCSTGPSALLDLASDAVVIERGKGEQFDQDFGFSGIEGGTLNGTLDIPAFSGCFTPQGDDLSPILTSAISSEGNPVTIKIGILGCYSGFDEAGFPTPAKPGTAVSDAGCPPDTSETVEGVPSPLPFPDYAPGATTP